MKKFYLIFLILIIVFPALYNFWNSNTTIMKLWSIVGPFITSSFGFVFGKFEKFLMEDFSPIDVNTKEFPGAIKIFGIFCVAASYFATLIFSPRCLAFYFFLLMFITFFNYWPEVIELVKPKTNSTINSTD